MRTIRTIDIKNAVKQAIYEACHNLNSFTLGLLKKAKETEDKELSKEVICQILDNASLAKEEHIPMCQDTGIVTCFVKMGNEVTVDGDLVKAINEGVREAYNDFYLRKSVADPITRINTKDNTPAIVHVKTEVSDRFVIKIAPKGAGSENMSKLKMLNPTDGIKGIKEFVLNTVKEADGRPCPPIFLGIGIGGNFEECALMAKEALLREEGSPNEEIAKLENEILEEVNKTGIGPMGLGGKTTCLGVFINTAPCHIASLPVAVNIQCHANRHVEVKL